mmetsp:Transcript_25417/g.70799  ORF Transcript_25417/g.70799 Transcript_25417/m.70799 type:complete len:218 (-) Transcript_25417:984-1637(-)
MSFAVRDHGVASLEHVAGEDINAFLGNVTYIQRANAWREVLDPLLDTLRSPEEVGVVDHKHWNPTILMSAVDLPQEMHILHLLVEPLAEVFSDRIHGVGRQRRHHANRRPHDDRHGMHVVHSSVHYAPRQLGGQVFVLAEILSVVRVLHQKHGSPHIPVLAVNVQFVGHITVVLRPRNPVSFALPRVAGAKRGDTLAAENHRLQRGTAMERGDLQHQ